MKSVVKYTLMRTIVRVKPNTLMWSDPIHELNVVADYVSKRGVTNFCSDYVGPYLRFRFKSPAERTRAELIMSGCPLKSRIEIEVLE